MDPLIYESALEPGAASVPVSAANRHYLRRVLRRGAGDPFRIADGRGHWASAIFSDPRSATAVVGERGTEPVPFATPLTVAVALLPPPKLTAVLRAAAAFGCDEIILWRAAHSRPRREEPAARWRTVLEDGGRVARTAHLPALAGILTLAETAARLRGRQLLVLDRTGERLTRAAVPAAGAALVIGPESGFTDGERQALGAAGARAISLGPLTLRAEQAVLAALAVARHELG